MAVVAAGVGSRVSVGLAVVGTAVGSRVSAGADVVGSDVSVGDDVVDVAVGSEVIAGLAVVGAELCCGVSVVLGVDDGASDVTTGSTGGSVATEGSVVGRSVINNSVGLTARSTLALPAFQASVPVSPVALSALQVAE